VLGVTATTTTRHAVTAVPVVRRPGAALFTSQSVPPGSTSRLRESLGSSSRAERLAPTAALHQRLVVARATWS